MLALLHGDTHGFYLNNWYNTKRLSEHGKRLFLHRNQTQRSEIISLVFSFIKIYHNLHEEWNMKIVRISTYLYFSIPLCGILLLRVFICLCHVFLQPGCAILLGCMGWKCAYTFANWCCKNTMSKLKVNLSTFKGLSIKIVVHETHSQIIQSREWCIMYYLRDKNMAGNSHGEVTISVASFR